MKATIDIPDELYRRVKSRTATEGRRIREVVVELFRQWLDDGPPTPTAPGIPRVTEAGLRHHRDVESLRAAYPRGYRLDGPLIPAAKGASVLRASAVERAMAEMDEVELAAHDRPC